LNKNLEEKIRNTVKTQNKRAYLIAKALKAVSKNNVTFIVSQKIKLDNLKTNIIQIITEIDIRPQTWIHHDKTESITEILEEIDIENIEGGI